MPSRNRRSDSVSDGRRGAAGKDPGAVHPLPGNRLREALDLDEADRRLIDLLTENGRLSNRRLATEVGLTEATVAARLRSLRERGVLGITVSLDWRAAGYRWDAWLEVTVEGRPTAEVGRDLARIPGVQAVAALFAPYDLLLHLLLPSQDAVLDFLDSRVSTVAGVHRIRSNITLETVKAATTFARMPIIPGPLDFPDPVVDIDDLDRALIQLLAVDGRQSNREASRRLDISETTVRVRLRRLESAGVLRITARSDPRLTGVLGTWGFIGVDVRGSVREVAERLAEMPEIVLVAITAGRHDVLAYVIASSRDRLLRLGDEVRDLSHVEGTSTWEGITDYGINIWWARFVDG